LDELLDGLLDLRQHKHIAVGVFQSALAAWHIERILDLTGGMTELNQGAASLFDVVKVQIEKDGLLGCINWLVSQPDHQAGVLALQPCPDGRGSVLWNDGIPYLEAEACVELDAAINIGNVRESNK
jgi:hypothetical protein